LKKLFTPVESLDADQARAYIAEHKEGSFTLLDVRQPGEYEQAHIPGAKLIPIAQLPNRMGELDPEKPVIAYWAIGGRSRVAAQLLSGRGFKEVYNLSGGIMAWNGLKAEGPVGLNMDLVRGDETPVQIIKLAYGMERSLGIFYRTVRTRTQDSELAHLLEMLITIEDKHKQYLLELYKSLEPSGISPETLEAHVLSTVMEGGFDSDDFIKQNEKFLNDVPSLLDLSMMLETQALDLYLRFADKSDNQESKDVLHRIGDEEKGHLAALANLRDKKT
jgi:sulfur-carrier protein adenylyltransferase/sulfurtransferase